MEFCVFFIFEKLLWKYLCVFDNWYIVFVVIELVFVYKIVIDLE